MNLELKKKVVSIAILVSVMMTFSCLAFAKIEPANLEIIDCVEYAVGVADAGEYYFTTIYGPMSFSDAEYNSSFQSALRFCEKYGRTLQDVF